MSRQAKFGPRVESCSHIMQTSPVIEKSWNGVVMEISKKDFLYRNRAWIRRATAILVADMHISQTLQLQALDCVIINTDYLNIIAKVRELW